VVRGVFFEEGIPFAFLAGCGTSRRKLRVNRGPFSGELAFSPPEEPNKPWLANRR
jgi:hypothetical protein